MSSQLIDALQEATGLSEAQILRLITRSPHTYKIYSIPKRSGGKRTIAQPAKETKFLQRWLVANVFIDLPLHEYATAYITNSNIKKNAAAHKGNSYISKFDFENFFPSIKESDLIQHFRKHLCAQFSESDIQMIARICCIASTRSEVRSLSIGAPSSPLLSNSVMFDFDAMISSWCKSNGFSYTRYADDLTFSTNVKGRSPEIEAMLSKTISSLTYPKIRLNKKKSIHLSKKYQRRVTGLVINNEGQLSIGRSRKRAISALIHRYSLNKLTMEETLHLQGLLGFSKDIEPSFILSMKRKYGAEIVDTIFKIRKNETHVKPIGLDIQSDR